ncbi:uncharacterized protein LOC111292593 [Durio zibethinus]|uniref:Uncharacterized protein LOC111292593 n=1 Tax=Durio zibethinus TaxID=66656 RepID=A0A6P5YJR5_DURZI|nr:uncharacterized protein LOC111292593 [Durio zibethinus]
METTTYHVLELNLISAQGLREPSVKPHRHMKTYAVVWVDSSTKLHTRVDRVAGENPTWNDKFLFKVSSQFLFGKTSAISVEIYTVGIFRDRLIGSVRLLISSFLTISSTAATMKTPAFAARLIQSPSGDFLGTLNVGGMVLDASAGFQALSKVSGMDYHDLMGENLHGKHHSRTNNKSKATVRDIMEYVPGDSLTSSSAPPNTVLRELSLKGRNEDDHGVLPPEKETLFEEITSVNVEQPLSTNLVPTEIADREVISDNEGTLVKMEKDIKMVMEENKKLREMVEKLMLEKKVQSTVISDLTGRVKNMERKWLRRNKRRKSHYVRIASALKSYI